MKKRTFTFKWGHQSSEYTGQIYAVVDLAISGDLEVSTQLIPSPRPEQPIAEFEKPAGHITTHILPGGSRTYQYIYPTGREYPGRSGTVREAAQLAAGHMAALFIGKTFQPEAPVVESTSPLLEVMTREEYETLVTLQAKAERLILDRLPDYIKAIHGYMPTERSHTFDYVEYKPLDRKGRDDLGRYDIEVHYHDWERDTTSVYAPSSLLWDPAGAIGKSVAAIEAERAEEARLEAEAEAARKLTEQEREREWAAKLAKKYGYVKQ